MTLDRRSARTLSLVLNCESLSASLTMTGRPVSMTLRTMLSLMAPSLSERASRFTFRDARIRALPLVLLGAAPSLGGGSRRTSEVNASSLSKMRPFSAPVTSMTASSIDSSRRSMSFIVISFSLNS